MCRLLPSSHPPGIFPDVDPRVCTLLHACVSLHKAGLATRTSTHVPCRLSQAPVLRRAGLGEGRCQEGGKEVPCGPSSSPAMLPPPAAPRSCIIDKDELKDGLRVLIPMDDKLLYAGHVQTVHSPDM